MKLRKIRFKDHHPKAGTAEDGLVVLAGEGQTEPPELLVLHRGMPAEVMADFDTIMFFGRMAADGPRRLTIRRTPEGAAFPHNDAGHTVLIRAYDTAGTPVLMRAKVIHSSAAECTVGELELIPYKTKRQNIRYPLYPPANIYLLDDTSLCDPQSCQLINISTGGVCVVSNYSYVLRQALQIHIELADDSKHFAYRCQVIRTAPRKGGCFEYGLSFLGLDQAGYDSLRFEIQTIQLEMERRFCPEL